MRKSTNPIEDQDIRSQLDLMPFEARPFVIQVGFGVRTKLKRSFLYPAGGYINIERIILPY